MTIRRHKEFFEPLHINTYSTWGRGRGIFAIFQYFCDFLNLKIHENIKTSVLFQLLVYFLINWIAMSDNLVCFDLRVFVSQKLVILTSKMAKKGSKWTQKMVDFTKKVKTCVKKHIILLNMVW